MGWRDKLKAGAEEVKAGAGEATARARETVHDARVRRELQHAYTELGRTKYTLADEGSLKTERLDYGVAHSRAWIAAGRLPAAAIELSPHPAARPTRARMALWHPLSRSIVEGYAALS